MKKYPNYVFAGLPAITNSKQKNPKIWVETLERTPFGRVTFTKTGKKPIY